MRETSDSLITPREHRTSGKLYRTRELALEGLQGGCVGWERRGRGVGEEWERRRGEAWEDADNENDLCRVITSCPCDRYQGHAADTEPPSDPRGTPGHALHPHLTSGAPGKAITENLQVSKGNSHSSDSPNKGAITPKAFLSHVPLKVVHLPITRCPRERAGGVRGSEGRPSPTLPQHTLLDNFSPTSSPRLALPDNLFPTTSPRLALSDNLSPTSSLRQPLPDTLPDTLSRTTSPRQPLPDTLPDNLSPTTPPRLTLPDTLPDVSLTSSPRHSPQHTLPDNLSPTSSPRQPLPDNLSPTLSPTHSPRQPLPA
ncbi:uncharacterized protein LOC135092638 [Scylla paramamosain]|uniref:uncharacterized protein LOC135092638 n=1 Tax=Scylla paramamosain TaxID=85552 RepID=UPI003082BFB5